MDIYQKIEEIRKKPEHIRLRYVWGLVVISMTFIMIIWAFSLMTGQKSDNQENHSAKEILDQFQEQKKQLKDYTGAISNAQNQLNQYSRETSEGASIAPSANSGINPGSTQ